MMIDDQIFISSIDLNKHPIKNTKSDFAHCLT